MIKRAKPSIFEIIRESAKIRETRRLSHWGRKQMAIRNINERLDAIVLEKQNEVKS